MSDKSARPPSFEISVIETKTNLKNIFADELRDIIYSDKYKNLGASDIAGILQKVQFEYLRKWDDLDE